VKEVHEVDALAITGDEGRGSLRKASGSWQQALIRRYPNGETRPDWVIIGWIYRPIEANAVNWNILVAVGKEINRDSQSSGERNGNSLYFLAQ
jgi:hypothetical protein